MAENAVRKPRVDFCPHCGSEIELRTLPQNSAFHGELESLKKNVKWAGQYLDKDDWKQLIFAAFARAQKESAKMFPALDGHGMDVVYRRSSRMSKREMSEVLDWIGAWRAEHE